MFKLIKWIDRQFYKFMPDPVGRVPLMHMPFWGIILVCSRTYVREYGLLAIWFYVLLVSWPIFTAKVFIRLVEDENEKSFGDPYAGLKASGFTYVVLVLIMIGIPGLYHGLIPYLLQTDTFTAGYHFVIVYWHKVFSFGEFVNKKVLLKFIDATESQSADWQKYLFFSHVVTAPILMTWFYSKSKARAYTLNEIERKRQSEEEFRLKLEAERAEEEKLKQQEQIRKSLEEKRLKDERLKQQKMLEEEKQKKLQDKINEVKGKDPWDSGFL